jgi:mRNA interferase MazF
MPKIINRGDIYWAELDPTVGAEIQKTRPVVILSITAINKVRKTVIVVPLSTTSKEVKYINVVLTGGSTARCDQLRSIDKSRLRKQIGSLSPTDLEKISEGVSKVLGV